MLLKKMLTLITCIILAFSISSTALASSYVTDSDMSVQYVYINVASSSLTISADGTASIVCYVTRTSTGNSIYLKATLQKYSSGRWIDITNWTVSTSSTTAYISETYTVSSGTYRVAAYFSVSGSDGGTESNTLYSKTVVY